VLAALLLVPTVSVASPSARLVYVREGTATSCPDEASLRQAVKARIGYDPFFPWAYTTVVVEIGGEKRSFTATLRLADGTGVSRGARTLSSVGPCAGLIDTVALAISIALEASVPPSAGPDDAPAEAPRNPPKPPPEPDPPLVPIAPSAAPPPPSSAAELPSVPRKRPPAIHSAVGLDALVAVLGSVAPALDLWTSARIGVGSFHLDVWAIEPIAAHGPKGGGANVTLFAATVAPCLHASVFFVCAEGTTGWVHAAGTNLRDPRSGSAAFAAVGPRVGLEVPLGQSLSLRVRADLLVDVLGASVGVNDAAAWSVTAAAHLSGLAGGGLAYRFP
jgi:hypothetical protein